MKFDDQFPTTKALRFLVRIVMVVCGLDLVGQTVYFIFRVLSSGVLGRVRSMLDWFNVLDLWLADPTLGNSPAWVPLLLILVGVIALGVTNVSTTPKS